MCGFVGFWNPRDFNADDARSLIKRMTDTIIHREHDPESLNSNVVAYLALNFHRLPIIDLSRASNCYSYVK
jgi:asparagine synthetase B (glutamine-hydrolysing)